MPKVTKGKELEIEDSISEENVVTEENCSFRSLVLVPITFFIYGKMTSVNWYYKVQFSYILLLSPAYRPTRLVFAYFGLAYPGLPDSLCSEPGNIPCYTI